jgi:hypothetical protein
MSSKALIILATGEKEKALTGILYARNCQKNKWLEDVKVIFFGPFENLVCEDEEVAEEASQLLDYQTPIACKFLSDHAGKSDKLQELGFQVEYVGSMISNFIKDGYAPMVW